jgi:two-component system LytT family response regulator
MSEATIRTLLVDDEPPARRGLRVLLDAHADVTVVGEARSGAEAIAAIAALKPSLVFLDVQMPDGDGFEVIRQVGVEAMPAVIFTTAFDEYAVPAFDANAVDYLLKPYDRARFEQALARARESLGGRQVQRRLGELLSRLDERSRYLQRIPVKQGTKTQFVPTANVEVFEAEANYVRLWVGDRSVLIRDTLTHLETQLDPARFRRVHRGLIVQLPRVLEAESLFAGEYVLTLQSGRKVTTGRTYRAVVQDALGF